MRRPFFHAYECTIDVTGCARANIREPQIADIGTVREPFGSDRSNIASQSHTTMNGASPQFPPTLGGAVEVEPFLATTIKGWVSGNAWLHAGRPWPDPSGVDNASGFAVFRRGGLVGNAEA